MVKRLNIVAGIWSRETQTKGPCVLAGCKLRIARVWIFCPNRRIIPRRYYRSPRDSHGVYFGAWLGRRTWYRINRPQQLPVAGHFDMKGTKQSEETLADRTVPG